MTMNDMRTSNGDGRSMSGLIQWPRAQYWDKPWNPIIGCRPRSPACDNCYARELFTSRFHKSFDPMPTNKQQPPTKGVVFVGNATDLFGEWMPLPKIWSYFSKLWHFKSRHGSPQPNDATYLFCTKRVHRMCQALREYTLMDHAYFGFTAENQEWYNRRFDTWRAEAKPGVNGWLSAEPLLGPIDLGLRYIAPEDMPFCWVATGCESGPHRRPCKLEWIESIVDQCRARNIPVFVKQLDIDGKCERDITKFPEHLRIRQVPWAKKEKV